MGQEHMLVVYQKNSQPLNGYLPVPDVNEYIRHLLLQVMVLVTLGTPRKDVADEHTQQMKRRTKN